jgi:hypothetical protein
MVVVNPTARSSKPPKPPKPSVKSPRKPFAYRPPDPKRATLLFDLDDTLMQVQAQDSYSSVQMPTSKDAYVFPANAAKPTFARFPSHGYFSTVPYYKDATEAQALVHYRPGVEPF